MLLLQVLLLGLIVSALMVGGAMLFHRYYPEDSPWLGYLVPPIALVALANFIEHFIALPNLLILLPVLLGLTLWMAVGAHWFKPALLLPTAVFLATFAFTFGVRCLQPDISYTSDGVSDLNMINNFLQGQTIPPPDTWMPPFRFVWYYDMQHYAASILDRLLGIDIGRADNVSHALLNALICVAATGAAHRLSAGRLFPTLAMPFLILAAAPGSAAYLVLIAHSTDPWLAADLSSGFVHPPDANPLWTWLANDLPAALHGKSPDEILNHQTLRLQVPGFWTWRDEYHANASGHFLTILAVLVVAELGAVRRTTWPWVLAAIMPMLASTASAWALPVTTLLCWLMLPCAWLLGRRPAVLNATLGTLIASVTLLWPAFYQSTSNPHVPDIVWIDPLDRVPLLKFLVQWWPIILLWLCGAWFTAGQVRELVRTWQAYRNNSAPAQAGRAQWRDLLPQLGSAVAVLLFLIVVPAMLLWIETVSIESRYNTIEKMWGYTWAVGLVGLFPVVAARANAFFRLAVLALLINALVGLYAHIHDVTGGSWDGATLHLEGDRYLTHDPQQKRLLDVMGQFKHAIFLTGHCEYCYNEAPALAVFSGNQSYIAWWWFESNANNPDEAVAREKQNDAFYSGAMPNRLDFLRSKQIDGVLIWPGDAITDDALAALKTDLAPDYDYVDCKDKGANNAGVFVKKR